MKVLLFILVGSIVGVPAHEWVTVRNDVTIRSGNNSFGNGDVCSIRPGGSVRVMGTAGGSILLSYRAPQEAYGVACPSGTLFLMPQEAAG